MNQQINFDGCFVTVGYFHRVSQIYLIFRQLRELEYFGEYVVWPYVGN